jgi:hypothetical protein
MVPQGLHPLDLKGLLTKDEYRTAVSAINATISSARATRKDNILALFADIFSMFSMFIYTAAS